MCSLKCAPFPPHTFSQQETCSTLRGALLLQAPLGPEGGQEGGKDSSSFVFKLSGRSRGGFLKTCTNITQIPLIVFGALIAHEPSSHLCAWSSGAELRQVAPSRQLWPARLDPRHLVDICDQVPGGRWQVSHINSRISPESALTRSLCISFTAPLTA